MARVRHL